MKVFFSFIKVLIMILCLGLQIRIFCGSMCKAVLREQEIIDNIIYFDFHKGLEVIVLFWFIKILFRDISLFIRLICNKIEKFFKKIKIKR